MDQVAGQGSRLLRHQCRHVVAGEPAYAVGLSVCEGDALRLQHACWPRSWPAGARRTLTSPPWRPQCSSRLLDPEPVSLQGFESERWRLSAHPGGQRQLPEPTPQLGTAQLRAPAPERPGHRHSDTASARDLKDDLRPGLVEVTVPVQNSHPQPVARPGRVMSSVVPAVACTTITSRVSLFDSDGHRVRMACRPRPPVRPALESACKTPG